MASGDPLDPSEIEETSADPTPANPPPTFSPRAPERTKSRAPGWWKKGARSTSLRRTRERVDHWGFQVGRIVAICLVIGGLAFGGYMFVKSSPMDFPPRLFPTEQSKSPSPEKQDSSQSADPSPSKSKPEKDKKPDKAEQGKNPDKKPGKKQDK